MVKAEKAQPLRPSAPSVPPVVPPVLAIVFCAGCAREIVGGAVIVKGTCYCSLECGMAATIPGHYIG